MSQEPTRYAGEPLIHSHVTDELPDEHPLAHRCIYCLGCQEMVHCENNECMTTWVECNAGAYCLQCFAKALAKTSDCIMDADMLGLTASGVKT